MAAKKKPYVPAGMEYAQGGSKANSIIAAIAKQRAVAPAAAGPAPAQLPAPPPFMNGGDMQNDANFWANNQSQLDQAKFDMDNLLPQLEYQKTTNETDAKKSTGAATAEMAGRGLFQSSIKDAALADIEAQRALRAGLFNTQIQNARDQYALKAKALGDAANNWQAAMGETMRENARAQSAAQTPSVGAASAPKPYQEQPYRGADGKMYKVHIYPDGRRVVVK